MSAHTGRHFGVAPSGRYRPVARLIARPVTRLKEVKQGRSSAESKAFWDGTPARYREQSGAAGGIR